MMFRILHCDLYGSTNIVRIMMSEMLLWPKYVAHIREARCLRKIFEFRDVMPCCLGDLPIFL
jgi:hypothetical protein